MYRMIVLFLAAVVTGNCTNGQSEKNKLSAVEFAKQIKGAANAQLIDVRTSEEFRKGYLEQALNLDWNDRDFKDHAAALDPSKPVYLYCLSGGRSSAAGEFLRDNGFEQVYELSGGMMAWRAQGLPEVVDKPAGGGMTVDRYRALLDSDKLVLVDFYATWCAPCKKMEPYLKRISDEFAGHVVVVHIDADANPILCQELKVSALPALKLYKGQETLWEHVGFIDEEVLRKQLIR